jgi:hypothetical protein
MKILPWLMALAGMIFCMPADAATTDPIQLIYRASEAFDSGGSLGVATTVSCTSGSNVDENIAVVMRDAGATVKGTQTVTVHSGNTVTWSTHSVFMFGGADISLATGAFLGYLAIGSTTTSIFCSAMMVNAGSAVNSMPIATALHLVRYSPVTGSDE